MGHLRAPGVQWERLFPELNLLPGPATERTADNPHGQIGAQLKQPAVRAAMVAMGQAKVLVAHQKATGQSHSQQCCLVWYVDAGPAQVARRS